ncbi:MAG TPA: TOPRIM nucleotidyl transferase/hydrolase domain-containing protein [Actinomycetota bacterium]|nr:TOPRIM nucleotidyl transferase/hydrolase domain-containing protein [Actinomycetota bacterium]
MDVQVSTVILVEGESDRLALQTLAARRGRDLAGEGVEVVSMGGVGNLGRFLARFGPDGDGVRLRGLFDVGEEAVVHRSLERAGFDIPRSRDELERLGFFLCVLDLEEELIRALDPSAVEAVIESEGELEMFRTFQRQPAWAGAPVEAQLRRFLGTFSGRKIRMAPRLVDALDLDRVPRPMDAVIAIV